MCSVFGNATISHVRFTTYEPSYFIGYQESAYVSTTTKTRVTEAESHTNQSDEQIKILRGAGGLLSPVHQGLPG